MTVDPADQISPERWAELQAGPERRRAEIAERQEAAADRRSLLEQWAAEHPGPPAEDRTHDPIGALVDRLREKWSYIDLDNMRDEGDWRELVEDMIMIIEDHRRQ